MRSRDIINEQDHLHMTVNAGISGVIWWVMRRKIMSGKSSNSSNWTSRHSILTKLLETAVSTFVWWASEKYLPIAFKKLGELLARNVNGDDSKNGLRDGAHTVIPVDDVHDGGEGPEDHKESE